MERPDLIDQITRYPQDLEQVLGEKVREQDQLEEASANLQGIRAQKLIELRSHAATTGAKLTEAQVEALVTADPAVQTQSEVERETRISYVAAQAMVEVQRARGDMLKLLVRLETATGQEG